MKASWKSLLFLITVVVVGALFFAFLGEKKTDQKNANISSVSNEGIVAGSTTETGGYIESLAQALRDKSMVLYGSYQSQDTIDQKALFGDASKYLDYVECDQSGQSANPDECISQKIEVYPSWLYQGKLYPGKLTLSELAEAINFSE